MIDEPDVGEARVDLKVDNLAGLEHIGFMLLPETGFP